MGGTMNGSSKLAAWRARHCCCVCLDKAHCNPGRQLSLQPEALGAGQEATNGLKHFEKRPL